MNNDFVRQLKEQVNIADVVGEFVRLRKAGANHMGLCPFHAERSPSFSVNEKKGIYYCFGCQRGGDVVSFLQEVQAMSFVDAVKSLAARVGAKLPPEFSRGASVGASQSNAANPALEIYYKLNRFVAQFYHEQLMGPGGAAAREYLTARGVSQETIKKNYLGYAPAAWGDLVDFLTERKAPLDKAEALGLIRKKEMKDAGGRQHYDLFRDRVIFPVTDLRGRVIAFGGRALGETDGPKYLNSPETPVFKKGNQLFGLFQAQKDVRADDICVLVEGYMDCLALHQAGIGWAVATLGTALTSKQIQILKRFTKNIVVLFDGDSAGQEAAKRAMELFLDEDLVVRGIALPDELDPDEYVRAKGADALREKIQNAPYLLDTRILEIVEKAGAHVEGKARAAEQIVPWLVKLNSDTARAFRIEQVAGMLSISTDRLTAQVNQMRGKGSPTPNQGARMTLQPRNISTTRTKKRIDPLDARVIELILSFPELTDMIENYDSVLAGLDSEESRNIVAHILKHKKAEAPEVLALTDTPEFKTLITRSFVENVQKTDEIFQEFRHLVAKLIRRGLESRKETLRAIILKADGSGSSIEFQKLMAEYHELVRYLDSRTIDPATKE